MDSQPTTYLPNTEPHLYNNKLLFFILRVTKLLIFKWDIPGLSMFIFEN